MGAIDKFCRSCGNGLSQQQEEITSQQQQTAAEVQDFNDQPIVSETIAETSRLSRAGVEKFLNPDERLIYATPRKIHSPGGERFGYVTNKRVLLYVQGGHLIKRDKLEEWYLNHIRKLRLVETGALRKSLHLEIEDLKVQGGRQDLLDLYRSIQSARA